MIEREVAVMDALLPLLVVWTIVGLVLWCCERLWRWRDRPANEVLQYPDRGGTRRAA